MTKTPPFGVCLPDVTPRVKALFLVTTLGIWLSLSGLWEIQKFGLMDITGIITVFLFNFCELYQDFFQFFVIYIRKVIIDKKGVLGVSHLLATPVLVGKVKYYSLKGKFQQQNKSFILHVRFFVYKIHQLLFILVYRV